MTTPEPSRIDVVNAPSPRKRKRITWLGAISFIAVILSGLLPYDSTLIFIVAGAAVLFASIEIVRAFSRPASFVLPVIALILGASIIVSSLLSYVRNKPKNEAVVKFLNDLSSGNPDAIHSDMANKEIDEDELKFCISVIKKHGGLLDPVPHFRGSMIMGDANFPDGTAGSFITEVMQEQGGWRVSYFSCFSKDGSLELHVGALGK
jgi:hypothetical protein